jgi:hypothetical protein
MRRLALPLAVLGLCALAACGVGNARSRATGDSARHRVLLVGDSLMGNTASLLRAPLTDAGWDVDIVDAHANGTGVLGPVGDAPDSLTYVREQVAAHPDVDTVVIEWAGACATCGTVGPEYGSPAFYAAWRAGAHSIIDFLHTVRTPDGAPLHVLWVRSPPMPLDVVDGPQYELRAAVAMVLSWIDAAELGPAAGPVTPDWYAALADTDGQYRQSLIYDGGTHDVRAPDRVHLTAEGARRTAAWTVAALSQAWTRTGS